jgi:SAM-dependent methyltransferase
MAHVQQIRFIDHVKKFLPEFFSSGRILEIGSLDINGSVRSFYQNVDYIGIDVASGQGVDVVSKGESYGGAADSFDAVVSCECMEYNPMFEKTWLNMIRLLKPNGLMLMTCASFGRLQHGTSLNEPGSSPLTIGLGQDYYRNLVKEDFEFVRLEKFFANFFFVTDYSSFDLYFVGLGVDADAGQLDRFSELKSTAVNFYDVLAKGGLR